MESMISVAAMTGWLETVSAAGKNPDPILAAAGLNRARLGNPEAFVPSSAFGRLLEEAARQTGDGDFGLHFGERFNPKNIGPLAYVVINSPTISAAVGNASRYLKVHNQAATTSMEVEGELVYLRYQIAALGRDTVRQHNEYSMAVILNTARLVAGSSWAPREVHFAHQVPSRVHEHSRIFGAPVLFDCPTNALVVEREFLDRQVPAADARLYRILQRYLENVLAEMPREDKLLAAIRKTIAEAMREGVPTLERIAKTLALSERSLERRLKERGTNFKKLVEDTRRRFAANYLKDREHTLTQIAFLLGYSEVSAFNRAFKRWTGATPLKFRQTKLSSR
jgi:AraC-like DNA-binding protein